VGFMPEWGSTGLAEHRGAQSAFQDPDLGAALSAEAELRPTGSRSDQTNRIDGTDGTDQIDRIDEIDQCPP